MCGILALRSAAVTDAAVRAAFQSGLERLHHRGPDGLDWLSVGDRVLLGATRLAIVDPAGGGQPFRSRSGRSLLVYNGELYNAEELRAALEDRGIILRTGSDSEVLVELFEAEGVTGLARLSGIFAFAIWDGERLIAGRDPLGVKPLYLARAAGGGIALASEIKALAGLCDPPLEPDPDGVLEYVHFQQTLGTRTMFRGIRRLPPGIWEMGGSDPRPLHRFDSLAFGRGEGEADVGELRAILDRSIRRQIPPAGVSYGIALSGGLDSSCLASSLSSTPPCYTGRFESGADFDESSWAELVVKARQADWTVLTVTPEEAARDLEAIVEALDEPAAGPGAIPLYALYREVAKRERVLLSGLGGDELFGGYVRHLLAWGADRWQRDAVRFDERRRVVPEAVERWPELAQLVGYEPLWRRFVAGGGDPREAYWRLLVRSGGLVDGLLPEWRRRAGTEDVVASARERFFDLTRDDLLRGVLSYEAETSLQALLHVEDRMSMAHSVEARVPLLDPDWVAAIVRVRPSERLPGGRLKGLLREVARDRVPQAVLARQDKRGFPTPLGQWAQGPLRSWLEERLLAPDARVREWFEAGAIEETLQNASGPARELWALISLELWLRGLARW